MLPHPPKRRKSACRTHAREMPVRVVRKGVVNTGMKDRIVLSAMSLR